MKVYTAEELKEILTLHKKWLNDEEDGERADLRSADLRSADLRYAVGEMRFIKSLQCEKYLITYTYNFLNIGCQSHLIEDWKNFDDDKIKDMDGGALEWWAKWKPIIMQIIEMSPAEQYEIKETR